MHVCSDIKETLIALLATQASMSKILADAAMTGTIELDSLQGHINSNQATLKELIVKIGEMQEKLYELKDYVESAIATDKKHIQ